MSTPDHQSHWQNVYLSKGEQEVSWTQLAPEPSLGLILNYAPSATASIVDVGGGASRLVDALAGRGYESLTVLDLSEAALAAARERLGARAAQVQWIAADATKWQPAKPFDLWHDRAAFHFLVDAADREAYLDRLRSGVKPGGHAIIATFAPDGPEKCSGLPVHRTDAAGLAKELGDAFTLVESRRHDHTTPSKASQHFQFSVFRKRS